MRSFFRVFALLLQGCELAPCDAAIATVRACDLAVEDSMYPDLADTCPSECYSLCISAAACDELDPQLAEDRYEIGTPTD
jgi:hypothetical protein